MKRNHNIPIFHNINTKTTKKNTNVPLTITIFLFVIYLDPKVSFSRQ